MFCTNCGNKVDEDAVFCMNCGVKLSDNLSNKHCFNCGVEIEADALFCTKCGNRIKSEETAIVDEESSKPINNDNIEEQELSVNNQIDSEKKYELPVEQQITEETAIVDEELSKTVDNDNIEEQEAPVNNQMDSEKKHEVQMDNGNQEIQANSLQNETLVLNNNKVSKKLFKSGSLNIFKKLQNRFGLFFAFAIIFLLSTIGTGVLAYWNYTNWFVLKSEYDILSKRCDRISQDNISLSNAKRQLESEKRTLEVDYNALLESDVFVRVTRIYNDANNSNYLDHSKITYLDFDYTVSKSKDVKNSYLLYIKVINPDGTLRTGSTSPVGYSFETTVNSNWFGWGTEKPGAYTAGYHIIEFWFNGRCVGKKKFFIN